MTQAAPGSSGLLASYHFGFSSQFHLRYVGYCLECLMEDEMSRKTDELICELKAFADLHEDSDIVREAVCQLLRLESELGLLRSHLNTTIQMKTN